MIDPNDTDLECEGFQEISYENNDVDTDRGTLRDRSFLILFKNSTVILSEQDFEALTEAMKQYVDNARADEKFFKEMEAEHDKK